MKTVKEVSRISGVSIRALHHYDAIGLLKPSMVTEAGYRLYDDDALKRLQNILLFRELQFPLKAIKEMLDAPQFNPTAALDMQIELLTLQRDHLDELLALARKLKTNGGNTMDFQAFDKSKLEAYAKEAKQKWGQTAAYKEFEQKTEGQTAEELLTEGNAMMGIFAKIGAIRESDPTAEPAQKLVAELQAFITAHYYCCTKEILAGLGTMYAAEGEMQDNIDHAGGAGTAQFAAQAIAHYVQK